jgi:2-dehydro-3-deoxyphosphogluconate aldolase/(4S)-4-hydroxy-2-oxoglutarate aldolase
MRRDADVARIADSGVIAIVRLREAAPLIAVAEAVLAGGVDVIEFTMTTPGTIEVLREATASLGDKVLLGAGTVLDAATARATIEAGARFIVSPTLALDVIRTCREEGVVALPGAYSPTEILAAWQAGADFVKLFPAATLGPRFVSDVLAPLPDVKLVPTGGVDLGNAGEFIRAGAVAVAVSRNLVDGPTVARGDFASITERARSFLRVVRDARASMTPAKEAVA